MLGIARSNDFFSINIAFVTIGSPVIFAMSGGRATSGNPYPAGSPAGLDKSLQSIASRSAAGIV